MTLTPMLKYLYCKIQYMIISISYNNPQLSKGSYALIRIVVTLVPELYHINYKKNSHNTLLLLHYVTCTLFTVN